MIVLDIYEADDLGGISLLNVKFKNRYDARLYLVQVIMIVK